MQTRTIDPFFSRIFIVVIIVIVLALLYKMMPVIIPFLCAFILAYLLNPLVKRLSRFMWRWLAILCVYLVITAVMGLLLWWLIPNLWTQIEAAWDYLPKLVQWYNTDVLEWINQYSRFKLPELNALEITDEIIQYFNKNYNASDAQSIFKQVMDSGLSIINNAGLVIMLPILTFYFLFNWDQRINTWKKALPAGSATKIIKIARDCDQALMAFVKGQLLVMVLLGIVYAVQLELIGLELGLIIGLVAGLASFVPYLGFTIGFISAIIAGLFQFGVDWLQLSLIAAAFAIGQVVEGYIFQPLLLGDKIGLSPLWVIFSVLAGAALMGFVGILIALPVSAVINVLFRHAFEAYKKTDFYKGRKQFRLFE